MYVCVCREISRKIARSLDISQDQCAKHRKDTFWNSKWKKKKKNNQKDDIVKYKSHFWTIQTDKDAELKAASSWISFSLFAVFALIMQAF